MSSVEPMFKYVYLAASFHFGVCVGLDGLFGHKTSRIPFHLQLLRLSAWDINRLAWLSLLLFLQRLDVGRKLLLGLAPQEPIE